MKKCPVCEKDFEPKSGKQIFCSDACKMKAARAKKKKPFPDSTLLDASLAALSGKETRFDGVFKNISEQVKDLPPLPFPIPNHSIVPEPWVKKIEEYCSTFGLTPEELIEDHKRLSASKIIKLQSKAVEVVVKKGRDYNPNDNWRFKSKLGKKEQ